MTKQYLILVDYRDGEKLRQFRIKQFNTVARKILDKNNLKFIWGFHQSQLSNLIWKKIKKNDHVFFSIPKNNFEIVAQISKKLVDKKLGKLIWPEVLGSEKITHFLLFDTIQHTNLPFIQTMDNSIKKITILLPGIYELKEDFKMQLDKSKHKQIFMSSSTPTPFVMPEIKKGSAQKDLFEVMRFIRDSNKVKKLKELYKNKCQICGFTFEYKKGQFYSEVHHYNPLEENGNDDIDNMVVVCPNHHSKFDYKMIAIDLDGKNIIDRKGKNIEEIHFKKNHKLNIKNLQSQIRRK